MRSHILGRGQVRVCLVKQPNKLHGVLQSEEKTRRIDHIVSLKLLYLKYLTMEGRTRKNIPRPQIRAGETAQGLTCQEVRRIILGAEHNLIFRYFLRQLVG